MFGPSQPRLVSAARVTHKHTQSVSNLKPNCAASRPTCAGSRGAPDRSTPAYALEELRRRGGFVPLLHLLPHPAASTTPEAAAAAGLLRPLPWSRADRVLRDWCKGSREYQAAAAEVPALGGEAALVAA